MQLPEWINLCLAIVTSVGVIVALILGLRTSRENKNLQLVRYKIELLDRVSNWLINVQTCMVEDHLADDFVSVLQVHGEPSVVIRSLWKVNWHKRGNAFLRALEEGRGVLGTSFFFGKDLYGAVKLLDQRVQSTAEIFIKHTKSLDDFSNEDVARIIMTCDNDWTKNLKLLDESIVGLTIKISGIRAKLLDSIVVGSDRSDSAN